MNVARMAWIATRSCQYSLGQCQLLLTEAYLAANGEDLLIAREAPQLWFLGGG